MHLVAETLDLIGKVLVSYTALRVHHRVRKQHQIDETVFIAMRREQSLGVVGITFLVLAYLIELMITLS